MPARVIRSGTGGADRAAAAILSYIEENRIDPWSSDRGDIEEFLENLYNLVAHFALGV